MILVILSGFILTKNIKDIKFAYRFQTQNQYSIEYLRFTICCRKANIKTYGLDTVKKHDWTPLFDSEPIRNIFYSHVAIFEIPK